MKSAFKVAALAAALALAGCGGGEGDLAAAANEGGPAQMERIAAPDGGDWSEIVEMTPEGGFRMGNPDAPAKLIEFASMTCPACARFSTEAAEPLREYVRTGRVSWEFRNFILNAPDAAASQLVRCQPPSAFFRLTDQLFETQQEWTQNVDEQEAQALQNVPEDQRIPALARAMELDTFFRLRGMPEARFNECLADRAALERLAEMQQQAIQQFNVGGTPTFVVNGQTQQVNTWAELEPLLRAAAR
jgi:protein-disulfide isomerase